MHPVLLKIGPVTIYSYGFFVSLGIISAYLFIVSQASHFGLRREVVADLIFWIVIGGFLGARMLYILVSWPFFLQNPLSYIFSRAGFVFYGGLLGGLSAAYWFIKRKRLDFWQVADLFAPYIALAHAFGRIGCFCYGCCYGKPTKSFWGLLFPPASPAGHLGVKVIPAQMISSVALAIIFLILAEIRRQRKFKGEVFVSYLIIYGIFRFFIEFLRGDERGFFLFFSTSQWLSLIFIGGGIFLFRKLSKKDVYKRN